MSQPSLCSLISINVISVNSKDSTGYPSNLLRLCVPSHSTHWEKKNTNTKGSDVPFQNILFVEGHGFLLVTQGIAWKQTSLLYRSRAELSGSLCLRLTVVRLEPSWHWNQIKRCAFFTIFLYYFCHGCIGMANRFNSLTKSLEFGMLLFAFSFTHLQTSVLPNRSQQQNTRCSLTLTG